MIYGEEAQGCNALVRISAGISPHIISYDNFTPGVFLEIDLTPIMLLI